MSLQVDGDGFLLNREDWNDDVMRQLAEDDGLTLNDEHIKYIMAAREMFTETGTVPSIRNFAKHFGMDRKAKDLYALFESGPMKRIAKYGAMPKPTGCV